MTAESHARLTKWWRDDPSDPDRMLLNNPHAQKLIAEIAPDAKTTDLGGVMSLNVRIEPDELVLRVHQPFVSRSRLLAVQKLRYGCDNQGLIVPIPMYWNNAPLLRCQNRWAELEQFIPHERLKPSWDSYLAYYIREKSVGSVYCLDTDVSRGQRRLLKQSCKTAS